MSAYQNVAENGTKTFQDDHKIVKLSDIGKLPAADALLLLDSNWGNGVMTLLSIDPSVSDNATSRDLKPGFDLFDPKKGFSEAGSSYSDEFISNYQKAQAARNDAIIDLALERLEKLKMERETLKMTNHLLLQVVLRLHRITKCSLRTFVF